MGRSQCRGHTNAGTRCTRLVYTGQSGGGGGSSGLRGRNGCCWQHGAGKDNKRLEEIGQLPLLQVLVQVHPADFHNFCATNKKFRDLCTGKTASSLYRERVEKWFPTLKPMFGAKIPNKSWKDWYEYIWKSINEMYPSGLSKIRDDASRAGATWLVDYIETVLGADFERLYGGPYLDSLEEDGALALSIEGLKYILDELEADPYELFVWLLAANRPLEFIKYMVESGRVNLAEFPDDTTMGDCWFPEGEDPEIVKYLNSKGAYAFDEC